MLLRTVAPSLFVPSHPTARDGHQIALHVWPSLVRPSTMSSSRGEEPQAADTSNGGQCGCQYRFTVFRLMSDLTLASVERKTLTHSAHPSELCRWISSAGRHAVLDAFEGGQHGCHELVNAIQRSVATRYGKRRDECLSDNNIREIPQTRPDLFRDLQAAQQDALCAGSWPCREGWAGASDRCCARCHLVLTPATPPPTCAATLQKMLARGAGTRTVGRA